MSANLYKQKSLGIMDILRFNATSDFLTVQPKYGDLFSTPPFELLAPPDHHLRDPLFLFVRVSLRVDTMVHDFSEWQSN